VEWISRRGSEIEELMVMLTKTERKWLDQIRRLGVSNAAERGRLRKLRQKASRKDAAMIDRVFARAAAGEDDGEGLS